MRLAELAPEQMTPAQRELAERITARRGAVRGPYKVWLQSPAACEKVEALGAHARFESSLPEHLRLLTLLIAGREFDAQYSWNAHVGQALDAGISQEAIDAIASRTEPVFQQERDQVFYQLCVTLVREHFVSDELYTRAAELFTPEQLVDTVASLGNYLMLSMCLNLFQVDLQPGVTPPFPDVLGYALRG